MTNENRLKRIWSGRSFTEFSNELTLIIVPFGVSEDDINLCMIGKFVCIQKKTIRIDTVKTDIRKYSFNIFR